MSGRGRKAVLPDEPHRRPVPRQTDSLLVEHRDTQGAVRRYDFAKLPLAASMRRSFAELFASYCAPGGGWDSVETGRQGWHCITQFATFVSELDQPPQDMSELTPAIWAAWRLSCPDTPTGYNRLTRIARFLKNDPRLPGPVRDAMVKRAVVRKGLAKAYSEEEFRKIRAAARRDFRAAHHRITENLAHLRAWREAACEAGTADWLIGEALDLLANTGHVPRYDDERGRTRTVSRYARALGGFGAEKTWRRLYLSRSEAAALAVLLSAEFGLNLTTVSEMPAPRATPDSGEGGTPTYRMELEKRRRGSRHQFETRNITDSGADSAGRLITQALEATAPARALLAAQGSDLDRLLIWRESRSAVRRDELNFHIEPLAVGVDSYATFYWARRAGLDGSPMRRTRRTVNALHRREPGQNTQDTHDRVYVIPEPQAQQTAVPVIADGALEAVQAARRTVTAELADTRRESDLETATADCSGFRASPHTPAGQDCDASFLLCLACPNARITPLHHPRLAHLLRGLDNLHGTLDPDLWASGWDDGHARLLDLKTRLGPAAWDAALNAVTQHDRDLIDHLLNGHYDS